MLLSMANTGSKPMNVSHSAAKRSTSKLSHYQAKSDPDSVVPQQLECNVVNFFETTHWLNKEPKLLEQLGQVPISTGSQ